MAQARKSRKPHPKRGVVEDAARWARAEAQSLPVAAQRFNVTRAAVHYAWQRLFPGEPTPTQDAHKQRRDQIVKLAGMGQAVTEIAAELGTSKSHAAHVCAEAGVVPTTLHEKRAGLREAAIDAMKAGMLAPDAAAEFGWTDSYLAGVYKAATGARRNAKNYTHRRDGRGLRAAMLVENGMPMREACTRERVAAAGVYMILKRRRRRRRGRPAR